MNWQNPGVRLQAEPAKIAGEPRISLDTGQILFSESGQPQCC
jgi:hypothetical protein